MHALTFRFDIDTHKCIRDGVPNLLNLADKWNTKFTFFLNTGKSISFKESVKSFLPSGHKEVQRDENVEMMSALQKLGTKDYLYAAIVNPTIIRYKSQIIRLAQSNSEMGIHGGYNHALWYKYAVNWNEEKIRQEIEYALNNIRMVVGEYTPGGFASPGWTSPKCLPKILKELGFYYYADLRCEDDVIQKTGILPCIGVNMLGEPGGVAFFESCRVRGYSTEEIVQLVVEKIKKSEMTVIYDHPYYAGVRELECISKIIENVLMMDDVKIETLENLL